jgi:hypothetical protein
MHYRMTVREEAKTYDLSHAIRKAVCAGCKKSTAIFAAPTYTKTDRAVAAFRNFFGVTRPIAEAEMLLS